jgi:branched-chain amino acid transport system permease protein
VLLAALLVVVSSAVAVMSFSLTTIVTSALITLIAVLGLSLFTSNSGLLSFGQVGFMAIGAYTAGLLVVPPAVRATALPDLPAWLAELQATPVLAVVAGTVAAALVGVVTAVPMARLNGAAAVIASIAVLIIIHVVVVASASITRGSQTFYGVPRAIEYQAVLGLAAVVLVLVRMFRDTRVGLMLRSSRDDQLAAAAVGVRFRRQRFLAWVFAAALGGLAGGLYGFFLGAFSPRQFYFSLTLTLVAMLVVGGVNTVTGALVGTGTITLLLELLRQIEDGFTVGPVTVPQIFGLTDGGLAVAILLAMYLRPEGLIGHFELDEWLRQRLRRVLPSEEVAAVDYSPLRIEKTGVLHAEGVSKAYAGLQALNGVSIEVRTGEIVGLIGANGSGKSTLINVLSGVTPSDRGSIGVDGCDITAQDPQGRVREGISRTFQSMRLFSGLTVRDNVLVAAIASGADRQLAGALASEGVLAGKDHHLATTLSYGDQRRVEIARALAVKPRFLLLDEPAAGMNNAESDELAGTLRSAVDRTGIGLLVVDHDMRLMARLCDRLVVLDHGSVIATGRPQDVLADPQVAQLYLGSEALDAASEIPSVSSVPDMSAVPFPTPPTKGAVP